MVSREVNDLFWTLEASAYFGRHFLRFYRMNPAVLQASTTLLILSDAKTIDQSRAVAALQEANRLTGRVIWLNPIPESKWHYLKSIQTMAALCPMVSCHTLSALAAACRNLIR